MSAELPRRFGPYVLIAPIHSGSSSDIYLARSTGEARLSAAPVAVKMHKPPLSIEQLDRVRRRVFAQSPNLPRLFEIGRGGAHSFVVMEHVSGWTLEQILEARGREPMPIVSAVRIVAGLAHALGRVASLAQPGDRVHGHVAPHTVLLGMEGRARLLGLDREPPPGGVLGHAPPEQLMQGAIDPRADVYALGTIAWALLCGFPWIPPGPLEARRRAALDPETRSLCELVPAIPPRLDALIQSALDPDLAGRFESADDLREGLLTVVPDARGMEADVSELVGETLWSQRDATRTTMARLGESMMAYHDGGDPFEGWGEPEPDPTYISPGSGEGSGEEPTSLHQKLRSLTTPGTWSDDPRTRADRKPMLTPGVEKLATQSLEIEVPPTRIDNPPVVQRDSLPARPAPVVVPTPAPPPAPVRPPSTSRRSSWLGATALGLCAIGLLGAIGWLSGQTDVSQVDAPLPRPIATEEPVPDAPITAVQGPSPLATESPSSEPSPPAPPPSASPDRPRPTRSPTPRATPSPTASPTVRAEPSRVAEISRLIARARAARTRPGADAADLDRIVGALVLEAAAPDAPGIDERLGTLATRVSAHER